MFTTTLRQSMWRVSGINQMTYIQTRQGFACCVRRKEKNGSLVIKPDMERLQISGTISRGSIKYILLAKNLSPKLGLSQPSPLKVSVHTMEFSNLICLLNKLSLSG